MKLALGTVQFGLDYGVANTGGRVGSAEAGRILSVARELGIGMLDTAEAYGTAEEILGGIGVADFEVVGKLGRVDCAPGDLVRHVEERVTASLRRLGLSHLYGLLLHAPQQLLDEPDLAKPLVDALEAVRETGLAGRIGVSTYSPDQTLRLCELFPFDLVQLPLSPIDARWHRCGVLGALKARGIEIHVRSVFLQGLLLMAPEDVPGWCAPWAGLLRDWQDWVRSQGLSLVEGALASTAANPHVDRIVVGVLDEAQLREIAQAAQAMVGKMPARLMTTEEALLDPSRWNSNAGGIHAPAEAVSSHGPGAK